MPRDVIPDPEKHNDLRFLAYVLRHSDMWPPGFEWDFRSTNTCALGMAKRLGMAPYEGKEPLGINDDECYAIFLTDRRPWYLGGSLFTPTPRDVAKRIDKVLATYEKSSRKTCFPVYTKAATVR